MLLVHPPVAKPAEPPAGISRLAGTLEANGIHCDLLDASLEGLLYILKNPTDTDDSWSRRAVRNCSSNLEKLRTPDLYLNQDRYRLAVSDLNRILENVGSKNHVALNLANYQHHKLSALKSSDLLKTAASYDENLYFPYFSERLREKLTSAKPLLVGFSLNYLSQALTTFAMIGFLKDHFPDHRIILGGGLVTSWIRNPGWKDPFKGFIDYLIEGPGEKPLLKLCGVDSPIAAQSPLFSALPLNKYLSPSRILPYAASAGCYWNKCSFCPETAEKNPYLPKNVRTVRLELDQLIKKYDPGMIHFLDNAISPSLLQNLAAVPLGLDWYGFCRFEKILTDLDFCRRLKKSGCVMVKLGLESGDQNVLDQLDKGIDLEMVSVVLDNLRQAGIATYIYLLFGTPVEDYAAAKKTMEFILRHAETVTFLNLAIFNMPVCSPEAKEHSVKDFYEADMALYTDFKHPSGWGRKEVRNFLDREFKRHPVIARIIRHDPLYFTSNHAPFFC